MSKTIKFWSFQKSEWKTAPRTLADVPEGVRCVVTQDTPHELVRVRTQRGVMDTAGFFQGQYPESYTVVQVLGEPQNLPRTLLSDVPHNRCVTLKGYDQDILFFVDDDCIWNHNMSDGNNEDHPVCLNDEVATILDIVAVQVEFTI